MFGIYLTGDLKGLSHEIETGYKLRSLWWFLKYSDTPLNLRNFNRNATLQRKKMKIATF
jgi:hypothetical protein